MELPIAPVGRIIKNAGAQRVSNDAKDILARYLEEEGQAVASSSLKLAKHAGRKTVNRSDIEHAINLHIQNNYHFNITNSPGTGIQTGSNNLQKFEGNIYSFNELYEMIDKTDKNADEIKENLTVIEKELNKEEINPSKIKYSTDWLKRNANWTIPSIIQITLASIGLG